MKRFVWGFAALGLLALGATGLRADVITIDDSTDTILVTFPTNLPVVTVDQHGEFIHFTVDTGNPSNGDGEVLVTDFLEADGSLSDRLIAFLDPNNPIIDVQFGSDPDIPDFPSNATSHFVFDETGAPQGVGFTVDGVPNANDGTVVFQVASDINAVPEPATLTLLGIGALGLCGYTWRRRKQHA